MLTLYHEMTSFDALEQKSLLKKILGKEENAGDYISIDFYHNRFKGYASMLTLYHEMTSFDALEQKSLLKKILGKEEMLVTSIFFFSHNVFYTMKDN